MTQAQYPKLAAVQPQLQPTTDGKMELHITAPDMSPIIVPEELPSSSTITVRYVFECILGLCLNPLIIVIKIQPVGSNYITIYHESFEAE